MITTILLQKQKRGEGSVKALTLLDATGVAPMGVLLERVASYFKVRYAILLIPICGFAIYDSVFQSFSSLLGVLKDTYPDVPITVIQMIIAIPPMMSIPGTLLSGFLAAYIHKKRIAEFALIVIFIGGMIPVVFPTPTIYAMFLCSGLIGVGQGLLHPMANAVICQRWADNDEERSRVLGFKQSFNYIGEVLVTMAIGILALAHWGNAFLVYLGVIPVFILTVIYQPKGTLDKKLIDRSHRAEGLKELFAPKTVYLFILFFFAMMFMYGYYTNIALLVQDRQLGNTADIAAISSTISVVSLVLGMGYGAVSKLLGRYTLMTGFGLLSCGMFIVAASVNLPMIFIGAVFLGFGIGIQQISTIYYISKAVSARLVTLAISLVLCFIAAGASLAPVVITGLEYLLFGGQSAVSGLVIAGCGYTGLMLIEGLQAKYAKRSYGNDHADHKELEEDLKALDELD